jgi:DNA-binding MarR family transcriptional regulator
VTAPRALPDRYPPGRPGAGLPGDRRGEQGLAADRWVTVIEDLPEEHTPNRALPQWAIDSLLFGMPKYTSSAKIWGQMLKIAMSAQARGWSQTDFENEVTKVERRKNGMGQKLLTEHKLWLQLKAHSRDEGHALQQLEKAWEQGIEHRMNQGFHTAEDLIANAVEAAWAWEDRLTEGKDGLLDTEMLVMSYVIASIEKRQITRVTCSVREIGEFTGLPKSTAYRALKSLTEKGFLVQVSRGTSSKKPSNRRAAIYRLGDPENLRYGGRGGPTLRPDQWVWKEFVPDRDADDLVRARHRRICVWGQGLGPDHTFLAPLGSGT